MHADASQAPSTEDPAVLSTSSPTGAPAPHSGAGDAASTAEAPTASTIDAIDVAAVAKLLRVGRNTVYAMVARNEIPHRRLGKQIRFHRDAVMRWLASWSWQGAKERR